MQEGRHTWRSCLRSSSPLRSSQANKMDASPDSALLRTAGDLSEALWASTARQTTPQLAAACGIATSARVLFAAEAGLGPIDEGSELALPGAGAGADLPTCSTPVCVILRSVCLLLCCCNPYVGKGFLYVSAPRSIGTGSWCRLGRKGSFYEGPWQKL
jgi:hypothetical protein